MVKIKYIIFILLLALIYFSDLIYIFILNYIIVSRGILAPKCKWYNISEKLLSDGSGINLFYKLNKKFGRIPKTYMFGVKTYVITEEEDIKEILDNSPYPYGPGKLKSKFFESFMKDNVGVSKGCPWKRRRNLNDLVLDTDKLHQYANKFNQDINNSIKSHLLLNKIDYSNFLKISKEMVGKVIFNTVNVPEDVYSLFSEANDVSVFYRKKLNLNPVTKKNYFHFLKKQTMNPNKLSLVELCANYENSRHEIIHQIPHFIFPIGGLYLTTIPRLLLMFGNHKSRFQKVINEIRTITKNINAKKIYGLKYLRSCIMEMLRLNNPVVTTFRTVLKDLNLAGFNFKEGDQLLILNNPILRNPKYFKNPNKFIPERWTPEMEKSYYAISFNQGPQRCPAKELAIYLIQSFIVNFIIITGIIDKGPNALITKKINTDYIEQMINTCNLEFIIKS